MAKENRMTKEEYLECEKVEDIYAEQGNPQSMVMSYYFKT